MVTLIIASVVLVGFAIGGLAIKLLVQKDGQFSRTCNSVEFDDGEKAGCACEGSSPEQCIYYNEHHLTSYPDK